ncbi:hypothetical protein R2103_05520 [Nitrosomonas sp. Is24]|uniref:hypothetical protein n=1 Tax=Nitrosomonas sp. Is24 TaxID=3080533 RepID=UPI00294AAAFF|nr:hypothetical protein [Nitrosomonas sp. Is24]MDV6341225.1 hypothetical protein [Nitrosomonas sp. Is24]
MSDLETEAIKMVAVNSQADDTQETIARLAKLSPIEYDRTRNEEAGKLKCRPARGCPRFCVNGG